MAVAYSGGRDSSALLHATLCACAGLGIKVAALHVHHGLSTHADDWLAHCQAQCKDWAREGWPVVFASHRVLVRPVLSESVESWARKVRYQALRSMALEHGADLVLLAHHRRDQAETFVLQALRGAGVAGLSAMPEAATRRGITWARPWLDRPREDIEAYVAHHRLKHIEDESNDDPRFARNRVRLTVWPALAGAFPKAEASLAASARWAQEATACLVELANQDLARIQVDQGSLNVAEWLELSAARRSNALRAWLQRCVGAKVPSSLVLRLMHELRPTGSARWLLPNGELRAYRGVARHVPHCDRPVPSPRGCEATLSILWPGDHLLPDWGGRLRVQRIDHGGVPMALLGNLLVRERTGAEQFQSGPGRPPRSLKKQFQAAAIPAWDRPGPLFFIGRELVFVPGLGIDARFVGLEAQPQVVLQWVPDA